MKIQSLSIVVPTNRCINDCAFCVSKQHTEDYGENRMNPSQPGYHQAIRDYQRRMAFARDNHCNTVMLTGDGEPTQNRQFLATFGDINRSLAQPFRWVSIQTAGALLTREYLDFLRDQVGVTTVSLSLSAPDDEKNAEYTGHHGEPVRIQELCNQIKDAGFNLRLSINMTDAWHWDAASFFQYAADRAADAVTFRILYASGDTPQARWIREHNVDDRIIESVRQYIKEYGRPLETLEFGQVRYDVHGISTVLDDDCMATEVKSQLKYLVMRPNCHLYTKWDSAASLLF